MPSFRDIMWSRKMTSYFLSRAIKSPSSPSFAVSILTFVCFSRLLNTIKFIGLSSATRTSASGAVNFSRYCPRRRIMA